MSRVITWHNPEKCLAGDSPLRSLGAASQRINQICPFLWALKHLPPPPLKTVEMFVGCLVFLGSCLGVLVFGFFFVFVVVFYPVVCLLKNECYSTTESFRLEGTVGSSKPHLLVVLAQKAVNVTRCDLSL